MTFISIINNKRFQGLPLIDGPMPGSNCRWVEVGDLLSVSLLQNRLNELGENVSLEVGGEFN